MSKQLLSEHPFGDQLTPVRDCIQYYCHDLPDLQFEQFEDFICLKMSPGVWRPIAKIKYDLYRTSVKFHPQAIFHHSGGFSFEEGDGWIVAHFILETFLGWYEDIAAYENSPWEDIVPCAICECYENLEWIDRLTFVDEKKSYMCLDCSLNDLDNFDAFLNVHSLEITDPLDIIYQFLY